MASLRQIRRRLRSVQSTKQIMRAMQLVAGSKLKRTQSKLAQAHAVLQFLTGLLDRVRPSLTTVEHPLCATQNAQPSAVVIFTSDTGLCGAYNTNLIQLAESYLVRNSLQRTQVIYVGKKGARVLTRRGDAALEAHLELAGRPDLAKADAIGRSLLERFVSGRVGSIALLYAQPISSVTSRPTVRQWLPVQLSPQSTVDGPPSDYIFEPSAQRVFEDLLPRWALASFSVVMLEAFASEHSARMLAMKSATDNAEELLSDLTLQRNKVRQATITRELAEIVGTVESLK